MYFGHNHIVWYFFFSSPIVTLFCYDDRYDKSRGTATDWQAKLEMEENIRYIYEDQRALSREVRSEKTPQTIRILGKIEWFSGCGDGSGL